MNHSTTINTLFGIGFGVCLLAFVVSILWLAIKAVRAGLKGGGNPQ